MQPDWKLLGSLLGVLIGVSIRPLSECGLDEAFGLSVCAWGVGSGESVFEAQLLACLSELAGAIGGPLVGEHGFEADAQARGPGQRGAQAGDDRSSFFVWIDARAGEARVVVDGDVDVLPTCSVYLVPLVAGDAMRRSDDTSQLLDIQVQQVARSLMFVARVHRHGLQVAHAVELQATQDAADGGPTQAGVLRDAVAGPALPPECCDAVDPLGGGGLMKSMGARTAVGQTVRSVLPITPDPLGRRLRRDAEAGRGQLQRHTLFHYFPGQ